MVAYLALSEGQAGWHATNHPGTGLNDPALGSREGDLCLIDGFSNFVIGFRSEVVLSDVHKILEIWKITAEEDSHALTTEYWLADPFFVLIIGVESIIVVVSGQ